MEGIDRSKYLILVFTNEKKNALKKHEELWNKMRDIIRSKTNNSDDYYEKYMKIEFSSNDNLPL